MVQKVHPDPVALIAWLQSPSLKNIALAILMWVDWYIHCRFFGASGCFPPAEFETAITLSRS